MPLLPHLLLLVACSQPPAPEATVAPLVAIPELGLTLVAPGVQHHTAPERWVVDMNPGARQPRQLTISRDPLPGPVGLAWGDERTLALAGDSAVRFQTASTDGGSGGPEAFLQGEWAVGPDRYHVACHAQAEPRPDPAWCLDVLRTADRLEP